MSRRTLIGCAVAIVLVAMLVFAQSTADPFPTPIPLTADALTVGIADVATLPEVAGRPPRMMLMTEEPGGRRLFVSDMNGLLYSVGSDGRGVELYLDLRAQSWGVAVQANGLERGFQSFAFHPDFNQVGAPGFGKFYSYVDTSNMAPAADFLPLRDTATHDTVLLEWTAAQPGASRYDGGLPRELMRFRQPFVNHNGGLISFNPLATPGTPDYGLLYIGAADGGSGGDPLGHAQNLNNGFGKMLRIDPLGSNGRNGRYGIPPNNPFVETANALAEIYAYGVRNPQRFGWDRKTGALFLADIGQGVVEEISMVTPGANLGWNEWEGSFRFLSAQVGATNQRGNPAMTYPIVEYAHRDQLFLPQAAITGVVVYRGSQVPELADRLLFGDNPSGEVFYVSADRLPGGGQDAIRRVLFRHGGAAKTLLALIKERRPDATRADLRFGTGLNDRVFLLNKADGMIRELVR